MLRVLFLLFLLVLLTACLSKKEIRQTEKKDLVATKNKTEPEVVKNEYIKVEQDIGLIDIIKKQGIPDENLSPGKNKQIIIYEESQKYQAYYFLKNKLITRREYNFEEMEQIKKSGDYPENLFIGLGAD